MVRPIVKRKFRRGVTLLFDNRLDQWFPTWGTRTARGT